MAQTDMEAFEKQVNLKLLDDIISFVTNTAEAGWPQKDSLTQRCVFPILTPGAGRLQEYGFLYLGELLERYEERFGMTPQDRRAIALALGYTKHIITDDMFVGAQWEDFIKAVRQNADGDIYLTGALYLLYAGHDDGEGFENQLKAWQYTQMEELIFAMSLFTDAEAAFAHFKIQLVQLLGTGRTIPVLGNGHIFKRTIAMLFPLKQSMRGSKLALLRALTALATSYVKEGGKPYGCLREDGYTPLEIAYINAAAVCGHCVAGSPDSSSITTEKIVIALFRTVLSYEEALPAWAYEQLSGLYQKFSHFEIKCYDTHRLEDALKNGVRIQTPETMAWFIGRTSVYHPAVYSFDILNTKWDSLAASLKPEDYQRLFESNLNEGMSASELQRRIDRYDALTQTNYLDCYGTDNSGRQFSLLVKAGGIDLWTAFHDSFAPDGTVARPHMHRYIWNYVRGAATPQAFHFLKRFLPKYGFGGMEQYLDPRSNGFESELWKRKSYNGSEIKLAIQRDYLSDDPEGQLLMLHWLEEYFFTRKPRQYLYFAQAVLEDETATTLLSPEDLHELFKLVLSQSTLPRYDAERLKQIYQTPEEQLTEQVARDAEKAEAARQKELKMIYDIEAYYADSNDGTFASVSKFLEKYRYYEKETEIAAHTAHKGLEPLLQSKGFALDRSEAGHFLRVCGKLVGHGVMGWAEVQSCITKVKEVGSDDSGCSSAA